MRSISDFWEEVERLVLDQYGDSQRLRDMIAASVRILNDLQGTAERMGKAFDLNEAEGEWLDIVGAIKNVARNEGENDADYRERIRREFRANTAGTPENAIANASDASGDRNPQYMDETPATFLVYTDIKIPRAKVALTAPAGVQGFPASFLAFTDGQPMGDATGRQFLAVSIDEE